MNNLVIIFALILANILIINIVLKSAHIINLYDIPDFSRKIHKKKIPLVGGILFFSNILLYLIYYLAFNDGELFFVTKKELLAFYLGSVLIFFIGFYDDKYNLKANTKLIPLSIISLLIISVGDKFILNKINFYFYDNTINLNEFSKLFTIFCFIVFLNAFNMIDGINGLSSTYFIISIVYLIVVTGNNLFYLFLLIPSIFFLYNNFKNKIFLGDNGSLLLAFILSCLFIKTHNESLIKADQIVLIMLLPGLDMTRVAITRLIKKKHPFNPDNTHLHHILLKKYNFKIAYFGICFFCILPLIVSIILATKYIHLILIFLITLIYLAFTLNFKSN